MPCVLPLRSPGVEAEARSRHTEGSTVGSSTVSEFAIRAGSDLAQYEVVSTTSGVGPEGEE
jgi:hypothetical protein